MNLFRKGLRSSILAAGLAFLSAHAILPDRPTSAWPWVGKIGLFSGSPNTTAVAIGDHWILTAGHVTFGMGDADAQFVLDSGPMYRSIRVFHHQTDDISLVQIAETMPGWYDPYWLTNQTGQTMEMVGYGVTGTLNGTTWSYSGTYGTKRRGQNRVAFTQVLNFGGSPPINGDFIICDFDGNGIDTFGEGGPLAEEATLAGGDSGGPSFIQDAGVWKVTGIHSWVGNVTGGPQPPQYGSLFGDIRVSTYRTWLEGFIPAEVLPTSFMLNRGILLSGSLPDLSRSDNSRMNLRPGVVLSSTEAPIQLVLNGTSPVLATTEFRYALEANANQANIRQTIDCFNYQTNAFEQVDTRIATTTDSVAEVIITTNPSRFISASGAVQTKLSYKAAGPILSYPWLVGIDRAVWNIKR